MLRFIFVVITTAAALYAQGIVQHGTTSLEGKNAGHESRDRDMLRLKEQTLLEQNVGRVLNNRAKFINARDYFN